MTRRPWGELSKGRQVSVVIGAIIQVSLLVIALMDIKRRPAGLIRGGKALWVGLSFINYVGPLAYFVIGRKRSFA